MESQNHPGNAGPSQGGEASDENGAAALPPPGSNGSGVPAAALPGALSSVLSGALGFLSLAVREWFSSLLNQPTDPPFNYDARFNDEFNRATRLVVFVILSTGILVGSVGLIADKTAALGLVIWAMKVLIVAFLIAIAYLPLAFVCGVRIWDPESRRKLTVGQVLYTILYIFVPWIPIIAFLWVTAPSGGSFQLLILTIFFYLSFSYMILNFAKAITRVTACPRWRVWLSVFIPIVLILLYLLSRPAPTS